MPFCNSVVNSGKGFGHGGVASRAAAADAGYGDSVALPQLQSLHSCFNAVLFLFQNFYSIGFPSGVLDSDFEILILYLAEEFNFQFAILMVIVNTFDGHLIFCGDCELTRYLLIASGATGADTGDGVGVLLPGLDVLDIEREVVTSLSLIVAL